MVVTRASISFRSQVRMVTEPSLASTRKSGRPETTNFFDQSSAKRAVFKSTAVRDTWSQALSINHTSFLIRNYNARGSDQICPLADVTVKKCRRTLANTRFRKMLLYLQCVTE